MNTTTLTPPQRGNEPAVDTSARSSKRPWVRVIAAVGVVGFAAMVAGAWWLGLLAPEPEPVTRIRARA